MQRKKSPSIRPGLKVFPIGGEPNQVINDAAPRSQVQYAKRYRETKTPAMGGRGWAARQARQLTNQEERLPKVSRSTDTSVLEAEGYFEDATKSKKRFSFKDFSTITLSTLAFIISVGTTYYTLVRKSDYVLLKLDVGPFILPMVSEDSVAVRSRWRAAFVNAGNRSIVVYSMSLLIARRTSKKHEDCNDPPDPTLPPVLLSYKWSPLVLKADESQVLDIMLDRNEPYGIDDGDIVVPMKERREIQSVTSCLYIQLIDGNGMLRDKTVPLAEDIVSLNGNLQQLKRLTDLKEPIPLINKVHTIFF